MKTRYLIGIDEAGRGPLAGPVSVGAVICSADFDFKLLRGIKDSKQLTAAKREVWFKKAEGWQKSGLISFHVSLVSNKTIDNKGLSHSIKKGIRNCLQICLQGYSSQNLNREINPEYCKVLLDGSLKAPAEFIFQKTIIKGDEKEPIIGLASIMAKVTRDRLMVRLARKIPGYGFEIHKGYGTQMHQKSLKKLGLSAIHRTTFCH